jgi:hypothetical protein
MRDPGRRRPSPIPTLIGPLESRPAPLGGGTRPSARRGDGFRMERESLRRPAPSAETMPWSARVRRGGPAVTMLSGQGRGLPPVTAAAKAQAVEARSFRCYAGGLSRTGRRPS